MDKIKSIDKKKVKKVVNKVKKAWYKVDKQKLAKIGMQLLNYFTKNNKASTTKTLVISAILGLLATNFGPTSVRSDVEAANQFIKDAQDRVTLNIKQDTLPNGTIVLSIN